MKNDLIISFGIIFLLPFCIIKLIPNFWGLFIAIVLLLIIFPAYFIVSPLFLNIKTKLIILIPIINALFFAILALTILNKSALEYLYVYIPLSYLSILIKMLYKKRSNS